jgi:hypothetical protein
MRKRADLELFGLGLLLIVVAIVIPTETEACSNNGFGQFCTQTIYTYDGVSASTAKGILFVVAALCIAGGVILLVLRNKSQKRIPTGPGQSATPITSTPPVWNDAPAPAPYSPRPPISPTPFVWNDVPAPVPSFPRSTAGVPFEEAARPKRRTMLMVSVGSIILVLAVIGVAITQAQTPSTTTFQQEVTTGSHIASIEVGTGLLNSGLIQGQTDTFHPLQQSCISFKVYTGSSYGNVDVVIFKGSDTFFSGPVEDNIYPGFQGLPLHECSNVGDTGVYKWVVNYNGSAEASITFQVVS